MIPLRSPRRFLRLWTLATLAAALTLWAQAPPAPTQFVTDRAGFLQEETRRDLSLKLEAAERKTGHQIIVYIQPSTKGIPLEDFAVDAFKTWKVGRKELNDGAALFIFPVDRKMRIEVGYGLEGQLPDLLCGRIIRELIAPRFRSGEPDAGVREGVQAMLQAIGAEDGQPMPREGPGRRAGQHLPPAVFLIILVIGLLFFGLFIYLLHRFGDGWTMGGGGWGGGGSGGGGWFPGGGGGGFSGGGGFGGGGGFSGGGGASGGW